MAQKKSKRVERSTKKRQCELGTNCPYRDEYQHACEYAHDNNTPKVSSFEGGGHKLGTGHPKPRQERSRGAIKKPSENSEVTACCDVCGMFLPLSSFDAHMRTHEVPKSQQVGHPSTSLINEQDREYEAALEADILRLSRESYEAEIAQQQERHTKCNARTNITHNVTSEEEELQRALKLSLESSHGNINTSSIIDLTGILPLSLLILQLPAADSPPASKRRRTQNSSSEPSPEPTSGELVMLRFRVTCDGETSKLQRSFRLMSTLQVST